jgi:putative flippase GtrA
MALYQDIQDIIRSPKLHEFIRFAIVGTIATGIHYGIYLLLVWLYDIEQTETSYADIAYTIGYILSFLCNMWLTAHFTFREKLTIIRGGGFALSHVINYLLHIVFLTLFLWIGIPNKWAPIPVFCIVIPINFLLVRFVFKSKHFEK